MFQLEGASTDVTGMEVSWRAWITDGNGSRISPLNENPYFEVSNVTLNLEWRVEKGRYRR